MSKPFVGIIGFSNAGKTSIIASLTGKTRTKTERKGKTVKINPKVINNETGEYIIVYICSPQERYIDPKELKQVLKKANDPKCRGVIIAIQPNKPRDKISMEEICQLATEIGYKLYGYALDPPYKEKADNDSKQANIEADVKARLKGLGVTIKTLDARKFPLENAMIIQKETKLVW